MYTLEELKKLNASYDNQHRVMQSDVDKANEYVKAILNCRTDNKIHVGDIVELTTRHGDYYQNAHIEKYDKETESWSVCELPFTPFVYQSMQGDICCNTSGGPWSVVPGGLKLIGKRLKTFKDFGHCGMCAGGAFNFQAEVNVWEYKQDEPLYGEYSTKDWKKHYISLIADNAGNHKGGCSTRYISDGMTFNDKKDYRAWLLTYRGIEFKGNWPNQIVVFCYAQRNHLIDRDDWDKLKLPLDTRICNGVNLCKVSYDDAAHVVDEYRFSNDGTMDPGQYKAYKLARGGVLFGLKVKEA